MLCHSHARATLAMPRIIKQNQCLFAVSIVLLVCFDATSFAEARQPLKGSASIQQTLHSQEETAPFEPAVYGAYKAYYPRQQAILKADRLADSYKLQAAEALYRSVLKQNARNAGALNGFGKVAYFQTTSSNQNLRDKTEALYQQAIQYFMSALRYQPGYVEAHLNLASVYMEQNRMGEAADEIARAVRLAPHNSDVLTKKGEWLVRNGQYAEAMPYLKGAIKRHSASASAHYYLAVAQQAQNEMDAALQNLHTTLWLNPQHANAHYQMAIIYETQGNGAAAMEQYLQAVSLKPELTEARLRLADFYERRGDIAAAIVQLKSVIDSGKQHWELISRMGQLSVANNQPEVAVRYYQDWMEKHPNGQHRAAAALSSAQTELAKKKLREKDDLISQSDAKQYIEQAIAYQPDNFEARMVQAKLDREIGKSASVPNKEPGMVDVALQKTAYQPYQSFEKAEMLLARYQFREAEQSFRIARRTSEGNRGDLVFGELFLAKGLPVLAEEAFERVLQQLPGNSAANLGLVKAAQARDNARELVVEARNNTRRNAIPVAILQLERALKANVKNSEAHYLLAQLYEKADEYAPAADHYYAYLQLEPQAKNGDSVRRKIENIKLKLVRQSNQGRM